MVEHLYWIGPSLMHLRGTPTLRLPGAAMQTTGGFRMLADGADEMCEGGSPEVGAKPARPQLCAADGQTQVLNG